MKNAGAAAVVIGFILWIGGEFIIQPYNIIGLPILIGGAFLYFMGRRKV
jgi:hypothetical protein